MLKGVRMTCPIPLLWLLWEPLCLRMIDDFEEQLHSLGCDVGTGVVRAHWGISTTHPGLSRSAIVRHMTAEAWVSYERSDNIQICIPCGVCSFKTWKERYTAYTRDR